MGLEYHAPHVRAPGFDRDLSSARLAGCPRLISRCLSYIVCAETAHPSLSGAAVQHASDWYRRNGTAWRALPSRAGAARIGCATGHSVLDC
jgi:hypothetical protein